MKNILSGLTLCAVLLLCGLEAGAQSVRIQEPVFKHPDTLSITAFLSDYYFRGPTSERLQDRLKPVCWNSIAFVKFRLDPQGKISHFDISPGVPLALTETLKEMVYASGPFWQPRRVKGKAVESRDFLLPVYASTGIECDSIAVNDELNQMLGRKKVEFERQMGEETIAAFLFMLRFDGNEKRTKGTLMKYYDTGRSLDCIVLQPIMIVRGESY
jgi:hypothetical protein